MGTCSEDKGCAVHSAAAHCPGSQRTGVHRPWGVCPPSQGSILVPPAKWSWWVWEAPAPGSCSSRVLWVTLSSGWARSFMYNMEVLPPRARSGDRSSGCIKELGKRMAERRMRFYSQVADGGDNFLNSWSLGARGLCPRRTVCPPPQAHMAVRPTRTSRSQS